MATFSWRRRHSPHFGDGWVPFAEVEIQSKPGKWYGFALQVDSGAIVSLLRRSAADALGLTWDGGRRIELSSVGESKTVAFVHDLDVRLNDSLTLHAPFAIASIETVPNLLGRTGIFDQLQVDFDSTLTQTRITAPWLEPDIGPRVFNHLMEMGEHILRRWNKTQVDEPLRDAASRFMSRVGQLFAAIAGLAKLHRSWACPPLARDLFELSLQFEFLMRDPNPPQRARQYREFEHVTRYQLFETSIKNPGGNLTRGLAMHPLRADAEPLLESEYHRVRPQFRQGDKGKLWNKWYCKTARDLAKDLNRDPEYRFWYARLSAWSHGDPVSTTHRFADYGPQAYVVLAGRYYARMLLLVASVQVLTADDYSSLKELAESDEFL